MSAEKDTSKEEPEVGAEEAVMAIDMIFHGLMQDILFDESWREINRALAAALSGTDEVAAVRVLVQFNLVDDKEGLADPDQLKWVGLQGVCLTDEDVRGIQFDGVFQPYDDREIQDYSELNGVEVIQLNLSDIDWDRVKPGYCDEEVG